jgi:hypothetical protein
MTELRLEEYSPDHRDEALALINDAFGFPRNDDWFTWKHEDGPWGPSRGLVAFDARGMVGVRLLLPWRFRRASQRVTALRAVEASTAPRARGRGIFSVLNHELMQQLGPETFLFSTPNRLSRGGYAKLGWTWLEPVRHRYTLAPVRRARGALLHGDAAIEGLEQEVGEHICTDWSPEALRWRIDRRTGHRYEAIAIEGPDGRAGAAYRAMRHRGLHTLLPLLAWGSASLVPAVLAAAARGEKAPIMLQTGPPGGVTYHRGTGIRRGQSLLAVWSPGTDTQASWRLDDVRSWRLSFADVESLL